MLVTIYCEKTNTVYVFFHVLKHNIIMETCTYQQVFKKNFTQDFKFDLKF